jgi:hemoglobin
MTKISLSNEKFGHQDFSFKAAGELEGVTTLVNCFYDFMETLPEAKDIRVMHPKDLSTSRDKLIVFLCGWLGGPRNYAKKYGPISIPQAHSHLEVGVDKRDAWLLCMEKALEQQPYEESFKTYLLQQLSMPAERIRMTSKGTN